MVGSVEELEGELITLSESSTSPRAAALERRLGDRGGYCDCEIFMNGWTASSTITTYDFETDEEVWPNPMPACPGARPRSTQPCPLWLPISWRGGGL